MEARVTLRPGAKGTKKLTEQFGDRLICVRYRYDIARKRRMKTVEIIVDEGEWQPSGRPDPKQPDRERPQTIVGVRIAYSDIVLRRTVQEAGGQWDRGMRLWLVPLATARALGLTDRMVRLLDAPDAAGRFDLRAANSGQ